LANESIGMNCRTVFRFRATKAATASVSVSVAWASLSAACDLANFGDRPTQIRPLEDTGNTSAHLDSPCPHQPTWRHSVVSLFELSTVVFFFVQDTAPSHLAPGKYTFFDLLPFLSSLFHIFDSLMYCVDVVRYMAIFFMLAPRIYGLHPDKIIHFDLR